MAGDCSPLTLVLVPLTLSLTALPPYDYLMPLPVVHQPDPSIG